MTVKARPCGRALRGLDGVALEQVHNGHRDHAAVVHTPCSAGFAVDLRPLLVRAGLTNRIYDDAPYHGVFHGHVRDWDALHIDQQNALKKSGKVNKKGGIVGCGGASG